MKKKRESPAEKSSRILREELWRQLWEDPRYLRLQAKKDAALRAWNMADAYKNQPSARPGELARADASAKRAMRAVNKYEEAYFRKHNAKPYWM